MKNNKTPGPDKCPAELLKWMDRENKGIMLGIINESGNVINSEV